MTEFPTRAPFVTHDHFGAGVSHGASAAATRICLP